MKFDKGGYVQEMKAMVDQAIDKLQKEKPDFEPFAVSIWTDPNAAASAICFESKSNSDKKVQYANEWNKKQYDKHVAEGNMEFAKLFEPVEGRNTNPADYELSDFMGISNSTIPNLWEETSEGECWDELEPALKEVGNYTYNQVKVLRLHKEFELSVNGREDWYELVWGAEK